MTDGLKGFDFSLNMNMSVDDNIEQSVSDVTGQGCHTVLYVYSNDLVQYCDKLPRIQNRVC